MKQEEINLMNEIEEEEFDMLMDKIQEEIMEVSDKYSDYIDNITIHWKENPKEKIEEMKKNGTN